MDNGELKTGGLTHESKPRDTDLGWQLARIHLAMMRLATFTDPRNRQTLTEALACIDGQRAEIKRLMTANGQLTADLMGCRDGALLRDLRADIERLKGRNTDDASARLHNICDALTEDAKESPFSQAEWDRIDAENVRLTKEIEGLRAVFQSIAPANNSRAYGGLLGMGQVLIDKDAEIAQLKAQLEEAEKH